MCPPSRHVQDNTFKTLSSFQHVQGPRWQRESSGAGVGLRRHHAQALTFDADGLSVNNDGSMIKIDAIPSEAERFADAAAGCHQKGEEVGYVMFDGVVPSLCNPSEKLARLSDREGSWSVLGFG